MMVETNNILKGLEKPVIIAGPCSAESESQVIKTARAVKNAGSISYFRCGIWKARSRPEGFPGAGEVALNWLRKAKDETGLKTCVEVAVPGHIELCLNNEVDMIWLGARTVVNPYSVNELSDALSGVNIPVMVKNPMHPDIDLWTGALERLNKAGINKLLAVHRGFATHRSEPFRNMPLWEIPIELKRRHPDLPVIVDPSHICGKRDLVPVIAQLALDMAFDGLMIEVHPDPDNALSDKDQQLDPDQFSSLMDRLHLKNTKDGEAVKEIELLRQQIDQLDKALIDILSERMRVAEKIGGVKQRENLAILQMERWKKVLKDRISSAEKAGLDPSFFKKILELIHKEAIKIQGDKS
jgi:chorismate mutase